MINKKQQHLFSRLWRQITDIRAASASKGEFFLLAMAAALLEGCGGGGGGSSGSSPGGGGTPSSPASPPLIEVALTPTGETPPEGTSERVKVADIEVTGSNGGRRNLELVGDDAHLFELNPAQTELYYAPLYNLTNSL